MGSFVVVCTCGCKSIGRRFRSDRDLDLFWSAGTPDLRTAALPSGRLYLDARLLGVRSGLRRLLLGPRHMGGSARSRFALDSRLLGLGRQPVFLSRRLLGSRGRFLRGDFVWIRLFWG